MTVVPSLNPLSYVGKEPVRRDYTFRRNPTPQDFTVYNVGDTWVNQLLGTFFVLVSKAGGVANWAIGGGVGAGVLTINTIAPSGAGDFTITGSANILITPGVNGITITATGVATAFDVDNGANVVPTLGIVDIHGSSATTFAPSGLETHTDAANEIYIENRRFPSAFIVDANATVGTRGEFTTITAAMAAATAGDTIYVRPGTYAETFTVTLGTSLVGLTSAGQNDQVLINGTITAPLGAGTSMVQNIRGGPGGLVGVDLEGGAGSNMIFFDCKFEHTGVVIDFIDGNCQFERCSMEATAGGGRALFVQQTGLGTGIFKQCVLASTSIAVLINTDATLDFDNCVFNPGGGADAINDGSPAAVVNCRYCDINGSIEVEQAFINLEYCDISGSFQGENCTCDFRYCDWGNGLNFDDSATVQIHYTRITSGANFAIALPGTGATVNASHLTINTTATFAIVVQAGDTFTYANLVFTNTSSAFFKGGTLVSGVASVSKSFFANGTVATVGAATGDLFTFTLPTNSAITLKGILVSERTDSAFASEVGGAILCSARRIAAGAVLVGAPVIDLIEDSGGAPTFTAVVSVNDLIVRVTGAAGENYTWLGSFEYILTE